MDIAKKIDHTMLKAEAGKDSILRCCEGSFRLRCKDLLCGGLSFGSDVYKGKGF